MIISRDVLVNLKFNLELKGYKAVLCDTVAEAADYVDSMVDNKTIGIGGSVTVKEMGLYPRLKAHNEVFWHNEKPEDMTDEETRREACASEVYISSVNAISCGGDIVNIDYTGNRVAAISYGPREVILVVGRNKVAGTVDDAIYRARHVASPLNAKRLNRKTPCAVNGDRCYDCNSSERICCNMSVLWRKPAGNQITVILVNEDLGF